jgi:hypothetical protein
MSVEKSGRIICDTCGLPIDNLGSGMLVWDIHKYDKQTSELKRVPHEIYVSHKGNCDRWNSGVTCCWWELRDFVNPEGFARWVNDRLREYLPKQEPFIKLIDGMWPLVLRDTTPEEQRVCRDNLEFGFWHGRPVTRSGKPKSPRKES